MAENDWIATRIAEAKETIPDLPDPALQRLEELLRGGFRERSFPRTEVLAHTKLLLKDIGSASPEDTDGKA